MKFNRTNAFFQVNSTVSFTKNHEDTPLPSPNLDAIDEPINSNETSTETVIPQFGIDAKYLVPSPTLNQNNDSHNERPNLPTVSLLTFGCDFECTVKPRFSNRQNSNKPRFTNKKI